MAKKSQFQTAVDNLKRQIFDLQRTLDILLATQAETKPALERKPRKAKPVTVALNIDGRTVAKSLDVVGTTGGKVTTEVSK